MNISKKNQMGRDVRKRTFWYVQPAKIQISLRIRAVLSELRINIFSERILDSQGCKISLCG